MAMDLLRRLLRIIDWVSLIAGWGVAVLVPAMVLVLTYEVVARYFFNAPTIWAHDLAIFMFGYLGLLSGAYVHQRRQHINVDILYTRLSPRGQAALDALNGILVFVFAWLVMVYGWGEAVRAIGTGARMSTFWAPPMGHFILMIPVGAALILLQQLANWIRSIYHVITGRELGP